MEEKEALGLIKKQKIDTAAVANDPRKGLSDKLMDFFLDDEDD